MNELARHIYKLLLDSDFAIIPNFGGFIAYSKPAVRDSKSNLFIPPAHTIGFNDKLILNDGLLVQSYMAAHTISANEAELLINEAVSTLRLKLEEEGEVELENIGTLFCDAHYNYSFKSSEQALTNSLFYGFKPFEILELKELLPKEKSSKEPSLVIGKTSEKSNLATNRKTQSFNFIGSVAVLSIAVMSFFFFTSPIENTEIVDTNYAKIFPSDIWLQNRPHNITTTPILSEETLTQKEDADKITYTLTTPIKSEVLEPQSSETDTNAKTIAPQEVIVHEESKTFHIIVASSIQRTKAQEMVSQLEKEGYESAEVLKGTPTRVSISSYNTSDEAYQALREITKNTAYSSAWVLQVK